MRFAVHRGFSLLEMVVALAILALSLGALYQAAAGAARNVRLDERYSYAAALAESILAEQPALIEGASSVSGQSDAFDWQVLTERFAEGDSGADQPSMPLYRIEVRLSWREAERERSVSLVTLRPGARDGV